MDTILGILGLAVIVAIAIRIGRAGDSGHYTASPKPETPKDIDRQIVAHSAKRQGAFDEKSATHVEPVKVLKGRAWITDGDTVTIDKTQIRLFGIDAPELNHPYGKKAKWALHKLCKGQTIRAEVSEIDDYGRTVAKCFLPDGRDLSAEMVKLGMALDWKKYSGGIYRSLETPDARKKLFLASARQKGHMNVWRKFEERAASS
ncbi:thermonuclease family protein [Poseidonocella sedimentorum]|uniref:Nuclease homologue n=1 Tax=Poseidonocella sedimentorum TaxID=871652 RepID=A0A1I6CN71_9RHOB|nr:thermonuclease family protein [Poseidonocella sedimentorum]SFQ94618.1 nuclease homologue [Poseidonocella sedimentorum]